jgi:hypothetical protein
LTRLIEVAHAHQPNKMTTGIAIGQGSGGNREMISLAYINAAKQVQDDTLDRLGLSSQHHQAIRRYEEVRKCSLVLISARMCMGNWRFRTST